MFKGKSQKMKKAVVIVSLVFLFLVPTVSGVILFAKPARAQMDGAITAVETAETAERLAKEAAEKAYARVQSTWWVALVQVVFNAITYFENKIAYDIAVSLATGNPGQMPLFDTDSWKPYLTKIALDTAGEGIGSLSEIWSSEEHYGTCAGTGTECFYDADCGRVASSCENDDDCSTEAGPGGKCDTATSKCIPTCVKETAAEQIYLADIEKYAGLSFRNLCVPPDPKIQLNILTSLATSAGEGPKPKCEWSNIQAQWDTFTSEASTDEILSQIGVQFKPGGGSTLDIAFQSQTLFSARQAADEEAATADREEGEGFKPLSEIIDPEFFKTPAQLMKDQALSAYNVKEGTKEEKEKAAEQALSPGALVGENAIFMAKSLLSTFIDTLSSKLLDRVMKEGLASLKDLKDWIEGDEDVLGSPEFAGLGGRAAAEATYADFITPRPKEMSEYSPLIELAACPQGVPKAPENCAIDAQFVQAVNQATMGDPLTVGEAVDPKKGLLHGDWPLISSDDENDDPFCFQTGYCYSNLTKLRKYRIIPIGWEIAANLSDGTETLQDALDNFNSCDPLLPESKRKWCHLIDPNWILKAPAHQCRARVFGAVSNEGIRQETCVDAPSCISENDQGTCDSGYGYCVTEKNIWRLEGDKCDAQFDSCRALKSRTGETKSYLINTVEYGPPCSADDVGCRWYSTYQMKVGDNWNWQDRESAGKKTDRIYFNKNVTQCDEAGCSQFYKTGPETSLNLLQNSSFENFEGTIDADVGASDSFQFWRITGGIGQAVSGAYSGSAALKLTGSILQNITFNQPRGGKIFTFSLYLKDCNAGAGNYFSFGATAATRRDFVSSAGWTRLSSTYAFPIGELDDNLQIFITSNGANCQIDAVQLEEANEATAYHDGWAGLARNTSGNIVTYEMKKAPEYLMCYNYNPDGTVKTSDDSPDCGNFSAACEENEAGCEQYTPVTGGPPVPGIATYPDDYCRAECVGYQTFKQLETNFEQDKFPVFFIPRTGRTCSASEAGCDEFTSLETEAVENYSYLRQCQKPGADEETFYTWEGSDTTGYQLKTWILKKSRFIYTSSPLPGSDPEPTAGTGTESPCVKAEIIGGVLTCVDDEIGFEDEARAAGFCTKDDTVVGSATYNPDCREFYDREGLKHYRLYSKTIVATDDCHPYRKTLSTETDCQNSGGAWDPSGDGRAECIYQVYPVESRSCSAVGCRAYRGNTGANVRNVFQNNFDADLGGWTGADQSSESLQTGGHSMRVAGGTIASKPIGSEIQKGGVYLISFWARTEIARGVEVKFSNSASPTLEADLALTWQPYTLGPIEVTWDPEIGETINIEMPSGIRAYFDNFILKQVSSNIYLVKDSWVTPASCDQTAFGGYLPQAMLGCEEYRDRDSRQHFLKSFTNLCREEAIGCQKLVDTKNTDSPYEQTFNAVCNLAAGVCGDAAHPTGADRTNCACEVRGAEVCAVLPGENSCRYDADERVSPENKLEDTVVTPADSYTYLIVDSAKFCNPSEVGCTSYGAPKLDSAGSIICTLPVACSPTAPEATCECERDGEKMCDVADGDDSCIGDFETVNFLNDETRYTGANRILCETESQSCEEYTGTDSTKFYFKDPGKRTCAWKEKVSYGGEERSGWWKKDDAGADAPCYSDYSSAGVFGIWKNADPSYDERVGVCPAEQNLCTKFVDPSDTSGENPEGEPYYYLKNKKLGEGTCGGMASLQAGCVLFNDTSSLSKTYHAEATYILSDRKGGGLVSPTNCEQSGSCKTCQYSGLVPPFYYFGLCESDSDCTGGEIGSCRSATENDANTILKVRRDRVCGEWITCESSTPVWDSFANRFKTVCDGLNLCSELKKVGQASECSNWVGDTEIPEILDIKKYTSRDITWKGKDYSGYAIPNQFQAFKLSQVNVAAAALDEEADWRLGLVEDAACFGPRPLSVTAYGDLPGPTDAGWSTPFPARACATISGEAPGSCYAQNEKLCDVPAGWSPTATPTTASARHGKCYNMKCVYAPEGTQILAIPLFAEAKPLEKETEDFSPDCRAYPESNSPFPESVNPETGRKQGFSNANVCEDGDDACECSYRKISYGGTVKYFDNEKFADQIPLKICAGGSSEVVGKPLCDGDPCTADELLSGITLTEADCTDAGGSVALKQKIDTVLGLEGYCLEKDKTTHINGGEDEFVCLSWLPVDRLMGAPDIYNQYTRAGYLPNGKENYCLEPELYKEFRPVDTVACFDADEEYECDPDDRDSCRQVHCPEGFVTIIGACEEWGEGGDVGGIPYDHTDCVGVTYDDCPYKCIPLGSRHTGDGPITDGAGDTVSWAKGDLCFPEVATQFSYYPDRASDPRPQLTSWLDSGSYTPDALYSPDRNYRSSEDKRYDDCELRGASLSAGGAQTVGEDYFAGCKTVAKIADADGIETKAWTNRLWESAAPPLFRISTSPERAVLSYMQQTPESPFGYTIINPDDTNNYWPAVVPMCLGGSSGAAQWRWFLPEATPGDDPIQCPPIPSDPTTHYDFKNRDEDGNPVNESRPYTFIETEPRSIPGGSCADDWACNLGVSCEATSFLCYKQCDVDDDCASGICDPTNSGYCPDETIAAGDKAACARGGGAWLGECSGVLRDSEKCETDSFCWDRQCNINIYFPLVSRCGPAGGRVSTPPLSVTPTSREDLAIGLARLEQIFAKIYKVFIWDSEELTYVNQAPLPSPPAVSGYDVTEVGIGGDEPTPPQVHPLGRCADGKCSPDETVLGVSVNGKNSGTVISRDGSLKASIKFFFWADANQMAIKSVCVDFAGIGDIRFMSAGCGGGENFYKNSYGWSTTGASNCDSSDFGHAPRACSELYYTSETTFTCTRPLAGSAPSYWRDTCPDPTVSGPCCVFNPRVQVKDNWGWCNGTCDSTPGHPRPIPPAAGGCYSDQCQIEGTISGETPWTAFSGRVIVVPK